jgi:hypothetical protein
VTLRRLKRFVVAIESLVIASDNAKAARSASVNRGESRQAATANKRSSDSPAFLAYNAPESTQELQPLI